MLVWFIRRVFWDYGAAIPLAGWVAGFGDHSNHGLGPLALYWAAFMAFLTLLDLRDGKHREGQVA